MTKEPTLSPEVKFHLVRKLENHKVIGIGGLALAEHESKYLELHRLSGVILFERNIESLSQVRELVDEVTEALSEDGRVPLIMADHEGDFVSVLRSLIGVPPSAMAIAATGDTELAYEVAVETGRAMAKLGVNIVLAPVADCFLDRSSPVTGLRTFGKDFDRVAEFVAQTVRGLRQGGVLTCVKHFPGHGGCAGDSHEMLPRIDRNLTQLWDGELRPFAKAVEAGVDMVMPAHVVFSLGREPNDSPPASFDLTLLREVLRERIGFEGPVITDALEMEGARQYMRARYGGATGGVEGALLGGSDLLLYSSPVPERVSLDPDEEPMIAVEVIQTIIDTLQRVVDRERVERKVREAARSNDDLRHILEILHVSEARIRQLRERATQLCEEQPPMSGGNVIRLDDYASMPSIYKTVAERSIVVVRDPQAFVPVARDSEQALLPVEYVPGAWLGSQDLGAFLEALCRSFPRWRRLGAVRGFETSADGSVFPILSRLPTAFSGAANQADVALPEIPIMPVVSLRGAPPEGFLEALGDLIEQRDMPLVLIVGWPLLDWLPRDVGALVTLGASVQVAAASAAVLAGDAKPVGSLEGLV